MTRSRRTPLEASRSAPVEALTRRYAAGQQVAAHAHSRHQLIYGVQGVMVVQTPAGCWVVPPSRAIWMPAGNRHGIRSVGEVELRSLLVRTDAAPGLALQVQAVGVSPLLRELIGAAIQITPPYERDSRDGRLMRLVLDELHRVPVLPLHLPLPAEARLARLCARLQQYLDDSRPLTAWAAELGLEAKTLQRWFARETGMTFGRWRQQARLLSALERLAGGDKVIDVALALGYDSPSAFSAMFRRQLGGTPSQFFGA